MKIGLVRRGFSQTGGAESYLYRLAESLLQREHKVVLFGGPEWSAEAWQYGDFIQIPGKSPASFANALGKINPREQCDYLFSLERLWHCDAYRAGDGVHASWLKRRKILEGEFSSWFREFSPKHRQILTLEKALYRTQNATRFIANSRMVKREICSYFGVRNEQVAVIYNGFDAPKLDDYQRVVIRENGRQSLGLAPDDICFLFVGTGWGRKGLHYAVTATERLAQENPKVRLLVAGRGKHKSSKHVTFLGSIHDASELYLSADVFVLPTIYDPFSNACLEAASFGLPVITTQSCGFSELIRDTQEAYGSVIVSGVDTEALIEAMRRWLPKEKRDVVQTEAGRWVKDHSVNENVRQTLDWLEIY